MSEKHKLLPAVYLILEKGNSLLLLRRFDTGYSDGSYTFISGHVEEKESFTDAIIREAKEEAGIIIHKEDLEIAHVNHRPHKNYIDVYFYAKKWKGEIKNNEPNKCDDLSWFDKNNLPDNLLPHVKYVLSQIKLSESYSEFLGTQ
ncbi:MAG: NUDIX domain-containing protein [Candidatus Pacearchaeota archaeon]|nr:NUDIX domain-containing protein [Candidatus Pacearchaeota archaeon]